MRCGARCGPGGGRAWGGRGASGMHGKARLKAVGGQGTRGAHVEHVAHVRDLGGVQAQRLVEGVRVLRESKGGRVIGARCVPGGGREGTRRQRRHAWGPTLKRLGAKGTRGAHVEHVSHVRDAGGVEAQWLVEGRRVLPSRREGMRCGGERCEPGGGRACGVVAARQAACTGKRPDSRLGGQGHARSARRT